jgi:hypothetical protein
MQTDSVSYRKHITNTQYISPITNTQYISPITNTQYISPITNTQYISPISNTQTNNHTERKAMSINHQSTISINYTTYCHDEFLT